MTWFAPSPTPSPSGVRSCSSTTNGFRTLLAQGEYAVAGTASRTGRDRVVRAFRFAARRLFQTRDPGRTTAVLVVVEGPEALAGEVAALLPTVRDQFPSSAIVAGRVVDAGLREARVTIVAARGQTTPGCAEVPSTVPVTRVRRSQLVPKRVLGCSRLGKVDPETRDDGVDR